MFSNEMPWLTAIILFPSISACAIPLIPDKYGKNIRNYALGISLIEFIAIVYAFWQNYDPRAAGFHRSCFFHEP